MGYVLGHWQGGIQYAIAHWREGLPLRGLAFIHNAFYLSHPLLHKGRGWLVLVTEIYLRVIHGIVLADDYQVLPVTAEEIADFTVSEPPVKFVILIAVVVVQCHAPTKVVYCGIRLHSTPPYGEYFLFPVFAGYPPPFRCFHIAKNLFKEAPGQPGREL